MSQFWGRRYYDSLLRLEASVCAVASTICLYARLSGASKNGRRLQWRRMIKQCETWLFVSGRDIAKTHATREIHGISLMVKTAEERVNRGALRHSPNM